MAAGFADIEVGGDGVACYYHVAGAVGDTAVGVGGEVVEKLSMSALVSSVGEACCWKSLLRATRSLLSTTWA